jgi:hypothetical protein
MHAHSDVTVRRNMTSTKKCNCECDLLFVSVEKKKVWVTMFGQTDFNPSNL